MQLMYNELSVQSLSPNKFAANDKMSLFSQTIAEARQKRFRNIRSLYDSHKIHLADDYTLYDWLNNRAVSEILRNNMYGMLIKPFIKDEDEEIVTRYVEAEYYFEDAANGILKAKSDGLAAAHLYSTFSVSLQSSAAWTKNVLIINKEEYELNTPLLVNNIFSKAF